MDNKYKFTTKYSTCWKPSHQRNAARGQEHYSLNNRHGSDASIGFTTSMLKELLLTKKSNRLLCKGKYTSLLEKNRWTDLLS